MSLGDWKRRYTVRKFDRNIIPESQHIDYIKEVLKYTPTQLGYVDHMWCVLGPEDQKLKDYLVENYYYCNDEKRNHREYDLNEIVMELLRLKLGPSNADPFQDAHETLLCL